jgi:hypothetical protein
MNRRVKVLIAAGAVLLGVAAVVFSAIVRRASPEISPRHSYSERSQPEQKGPIVLLGYDGPYGRVVDAIHIDVRRGIPHTRSEETPIEDVSRYVTAQLDGKASVWVVVTASNEEKFGDVIKVIDACRTTRVHGIVLNQFPGLWRE